MHEKKYLSHVKFQNMGHYASQCPEKNKAKQQRKQFARSAEALGGVDELAPKLKTTLSMVSCLSTNTVSGVGWYVNNGASRHMTFNKKAFSKLPKREDGIQVEFGDDATYPVTRMDSVSFHMPPSYVLELHDVLYVPSFTHNLISVF